MALAKLWKNGVSGGLQIHCRIKMLPIDGEGL
jgi:hypothetical protein